MNTSVPMLPHVGPTSYRCCLPTLQRTALTLFVTPSCCIPSRHSTITLSLVIFQVHQHCCCQTQIVAPGLFCFASHLGIQPICFHLCFFKYTNIAAAKRRSLHRDSFFCASHLGIQPLCFHLCFFKYTNSAAAKRRSLHQDSFVLHPISAFNQFASTYLKYRMPTDPPPPLKKNYSMVKMCNRPPKKTRVQCCTATPPPLAGTP